MKELGPCNHLSAKQGCLPQYPFWLDLLSTICPLPVSMTFCISADMLWASLKVPLTGHLSQSLTAVTAVPDSICTNNADLIFSAPINQVRITLAIPTSAHRILEPCPLNRCLIRLNRWGSVPDQVLRLMSFANVSGRKHFKNINPLIFNVIFTLY